MITTMMNATTGDVPLDRWAVFEKSRGRLQGIALRIVGSFDDAEDLVQETSLRWLQVDLATVRAPEGWLVAVITRLSIDRLRRATSEPRMYDDARNLGLAIASDRTMPEPLDDVATEVFDAFRLLRDGLRPAERTAFV